ncbi:MAG: ATP-dependent RNA helicase DbpA [Gammaproteobacteria bacterium]|jgi:ATP-independent RNA helicase DbpA|nr:ATP-dependent RNA helicase DbpA [Gammaproteobacteria bacterium]
MSAADFGTLPLAPALLDNLRALGFASMTPIQALSLPAIIAGHDVLGQARTGSGKTAAFGLGLLTHLDARRFAVQALVLCPTRELADQVASALRDLARAIPNIKIATLCGGAPLLAQTSSLAGGVHIVVGTPGRVEAHLRKGSLQLNALTMLVLDEADRMLDMGFEESVDNIIRQAPAERQTLLFSATYPDSVQHIAERTLRQPVSARVDEGEQRPSVEQSFVCVADDAERLAVLQRLLHRPAAALVFCNTRKTTQLVADTLRSARFSAAALHGDMEQRERDLTLLRFANQSTRVLVATDVAARGLDIQGLDAVVNYELAHEVDVHVHRIGRTGRAGAEGVAITLYGAAEQPRVAALAEQLEITVRAATLPPRRLLEQRPPKALMVTLRIDGGKKQKLRKGDVLGALTGAEGIAGEQVGRIDVLPAATYVAVRREAARAALAKLTEGRLKGRRFRVRRLHG